MEIKALYLKAFMTNCYIVSDSDNNCVIIDPASDGNQIISEINKQNLKPKAILLTHGHFDHIYAIPELLEEYDNIPIYIHKEEIHFLTDVNYNLSLAMFGENFTCCADVTAVSDKQTIKIGELSFEVMHTPGHTPGSVCYLCDNAIFSGDTLFASTVGRTDFPGGDYATLLYSLKKLKNLDGDYYIYPGHNAATTLSREKICNEFMQL